MSWFQDNKFNAMLGGVTLVGAAGLIFWGLNSSKKYDQAKEEYQTALDEVGQIEKSSLYPTQANATGKATALGKYRDELAALQTRFDKYRAGDLKNIPTQDFTVLLKESDDKVRKAFEASNTKLPASFFLGFETYAATAARQESTGILSYQAKAVTELMLALAAAGPAELSNVHRPKLPEEEGKKWEAPAGAVSRALPIELTFAGSESSLRKFVSALSASSSNFYVIRSIRISNEKAKGPSTADVKFETAGGGAADFGNAFAPAADSAAPATPAADSSRSLMQVAGNENLRVFVRIDVMQFLPAVKLPEL